MTREEAIKLLANIKGYTHITLYEWLDVEKEALDMAIDALKADTAEVVRCKDCKWYGHLGCAIRIVDDSDKPNDNDFCSFGERREE